MRHIGQRFAITAALLVALVISVNAQNRFDQAGLGTVITLP
jgi:hypothetical protein